MGRQAFRPDRCHTGLMRPPPRLIKMRVLLQDRLAMPSNSNLLFLTAAPLLLAIATAQADQAPQCQLALAGLQVAVSGADPNAPGDLQLTVADHERLLNRLSAPETGQVEQCWIADLNGNRLQEVVVVLREADTGLKVRVFEWQDGHFNLLKISALPADQTGVPPGQDRIEVIENTLIWTGPTAARPAGAKPARLRYALNGQRWEPAAPAP